MSNQFYKLLCSQCGHLIDFDPLTWKCSCGGCWDLDFTSVWKDIFHQYHVQSRESMSRMLQQISILGEGHSPEIAEEPYCTFKLEYLNPTGSFKDRGAAFLLSALKKQGVTTVIEDSSGNAGASIACYASRLGISARVIVPEKTPEPKLRQIKDFGGEIVQVRGGREAAARYAYQLAEKICYASHVFNPFFIAGVMTLAFDIWASGTSLPDRIFIPAGNGTLLLGLYHGFKALYDLGFTENIPALWGVQSSVINPLVVLLEKGYLPEIQNTKHTIASGIAVSSPARSMQIIKAVKETGGRMNDVEEHEIISALQMLLKRGYYVEATSAAALAAFKKHQKNITGYSMIILTGTGFKQL